MNSGGFARKKEKKGRAMTARSVPGGELPSLGEVLNFVTRELGFSLPDPNPVVTVRTSGVPQPWIDNLTLNFTSILSEARKRFLVVIDDFNCLNEVLKFCRETPIEKAYEVENGSHFDAPTRSLKKPFTMLKLRPKQKKVVAAMAAKYEIEISSLEAAFNMIYNFRHRRLDDPRSVRHEGRDFLAFTDANEKEIVWCDVTHSNDPVALTPEDPKPRPVPAYVCDVCEQSAKKKCARCGCRRYCSVDCQRKDWSTHKADCRR